MSNQRLVVSDVKRQSRKLSPVWPGGLGTEQVTQRLDGRAKDRQAVGWSDTTKCEVCHGEEAERRLRLRSDSRGRRHLSWGLQQRAAWGPQIWVLFMNLGFILSTIRSCWTGVIHLFHLKAITTYSVENG